MSETETIDKELVEENETTTATVNEEEQSQQQETEKKDLENDPIVIKAKALEVNELFDFIKDLDNQYNTYITGIKSILIRIAAEKLEERGMSAVNNIVDTIVDRLAGSKVPVSISYIRKCIPDSLKKVTKSRSKPQTQQTQQPSEDFKTDEEIEKEHIKESTMIPEIDHDSSIQQQHQESNLEQKLELALRRIENQDEEIQTLKKVIKEKNLETSYQEAIQEIKIIKWDKNKINEIDAAWKNSLKEVIFKIDARTNKLISAITDKAYKKDTNK
jgi:hypothetical protein